MDGADGGDVQGDRSAECFSCRLHPASASGGTGWQSWLAALPPYAAFLQSFAARDPDFAQAWTAYAPGYFENWGRLLYTLALTQATRRNRRVDPDARAAIAETLAQNAARPAARLRPVVPPSRRGGGCGRGNGSIALP